VRTIDEFYAEAMRLAKRLGKVPDLTCFDKVGMAAYNRRVKAQRWLKDAARLAHMYQVIDDYIRHNGTPAVPALPTRWTPKKSKAKRGDKHP
jgi:hypothetical protein